MPLRTFICTYCGTETSAPNRPGSPWVAAALAIPFVLPAVVYLAWRYTSRSLTCPVCAHAQLIPFDAPLARTWRSAGWLPGHANSTASGRTDPRIERIEQAIDAIALEVERVARLQQSQSQHRLP